MSALPEDLAAAAAAMPRSTTSASMSAAAAAAAASALVTGGNGPAPIALDLRPTSLHESALSPAEHAVFPIWLSNIKAAPSGQPGLYDEQDALNFLRRDCSIDIEDEIQILSLFERTPRGMTAGHLYALMRLASWVKAGQAPSRRLLFTQAPPLKMKKLPPQSPPKPALLKAEQATPAPSVIAPSVISAAVQTPPSVVAPTPARYPTAAPPSQTPALSPYARSSKGFASASSSVAPGILNKPTPALPPQAVPIAATAAAGVAPPQPSSTAMSMFPSRVGTSAITIAPTPQLPPSSNNGVDALLGFDPAPNPFKQAAGSAQLKQPQQFQNPPPPAPPPRPQQPRIVKPTPVVASAAGASNPFRSASLSLPRSAPMYGVSVSGQSDHSGGSGAQGPFANPGEYSYSAVAAVAAAAQAAAATRPTEQASPPLPPRPSFGGGEAAALGQLIQTAAPPPLPARVHPLIQAGLYASSEVRKRKEALPPKTFSVIQSSSSTSKASKPKPRLLTGEAAPKDVLEMLPPPQHQSSAKKRAAAAAAAAAGGGTTTPFSHRGTETRRSVSDVQAFLRRHSEHDSELGGNGLGASDLGRTRSRGATSGVGVGLSEDGGGGGAGAGASGRHGAQDVVPGSTSGAKTTLLGNPATYAPKASYAHVSKAKGSLPAWLREQEELQRSALVQEDPDRPPTNPRSPFSPNTPQYQHQHARSHSSSNGHVRRSLNNTSGSGSNPNRHSMISALDSAVLEDEEEEEGDGVRGRRGVDDDGEDGEDEEEDDEDFVDAPAALHRTRSRSRSGPGAADDTRSEQEMSEQARSAATSIERPHNPFAERPLGKGHPSTTSSTAASPSAAAMAALVSEPGGATLAQRPLGRSKTLHGKGPAPPPPGHAHGHAHGSAHAHAPPPAPPRRRLDSSPATAFESPSFTLSSGQPFQPPPQRSPTAEMRRGGSLRISSSASHGRFPTDDGMSPGGGGSVRGSAPALPPPKRANSMTWRQSSGGSSSPTDVNSGRGGSGTSGTITAAAATAGSRASVVGASIKEKMTDLFRQSIGGGEGAGGLSREYSSNGISDAGNGTTPKNEMGGFGNFLTKPSPKGERPLDLLQQDIAGVVERHGWLARAAEKAKGRPITEGRRGLMSERERNGGEADAADDDVGVEDGADDSYETEKHPHRPHQAHQPKTRLSDRPQPDDGHHYDDDEVEQDPDAHHSTGSGHVRRSASLRRHQQRAASPDQSPFGDSNRPTDGYARLA
ncbi:hypothetical protein OC834_007127 [Tilletia horrida]|nr:hypothetical protein OC834_007127 [Tilletia horrida]